MKYGAKTRWVCVFLAAVLLLILCSAVHDCHGLAADSDCAVCLVLSAWKLAVPVLVSVMGMCCLVVSAQQLQNRPDHRAEEPSLVAQKVKLSD